MTKYYYIWLMGKRIKYSPREYENNRPPVFLKVDRDAKYTMMCIQHWVLVAKELGGFLYFVCDNKNLERAILKNVEFCNLDFKFITSKRRQLCRIASNLYSYFWRNPAYAHLTPFYISKLTGTKYHWDIDADDTLFLLPPKEVADKLRKVEKKAIDDGITAFSLDMWRTISPFDNWSMGVMFVNENVDLFGIFKAIKNRDWIRLYSVKRGLYKKRNANTDNFFTYLNDEGLVKTETYYFEDTGFIHWDISSAGKCTSLLYHWKCGKLHLPLLSAVPQNGVYISKDTFDVKAIRLE